MAMSYAQITKPETADSRWKDLYRIGAIACSTFPVFILFAMIAYFIWPYAPGNTSVEQIYAELNSNRLGGLVSLDLSVVLLMPVFLFEILAVYAALKDVNESYALIALVFGIMGVVLWITSKPLVEMTYLSDQYAAATSEAAKSYYLAAGEALAAVSSGTAWMVSQVFISISGTISSLLMLRSRFFGKATAYIGLALAILGICFWIPVIGAGLSLLSTIGGVAWYALIARDFYKFSKSQI